MSIKDLDIELEDDGRGGQSKFDVWRNRAGFFLAPLVFLVIWLMPMPSLKPEAHSLAAIIAAVVIFWICE
jgi:sodium-dependent dicarboxylate transporter 2/3/5